MHVPVSQAIGSQQESNGHMPPNAATESPLSSHLAGKAALVTGGAKRVGRAIALRLADAGMDVAITYHRSEDEANEVVKAIEAKGRRSLAIQADFASVATPGEQGLAVIDRVFDAYTKVFDNCHALINNASFFEPTPFDQLKPDAFERNLAVNGKAPIFLIQRFAPLLTANAQGQPGDDGFTPGRVVNFIDIHVMSQPLRGYLAYNASKAVLQEATMTLAMELAPRITVNAIAPGVVAWADSYTDDERKRYMDRVPLARPGTPEDAAAAVHYLVGDGSYCTGQVIKMDGGRLLT